jgi:hypothetical protein
MSDTDSLSFRLYSENDGKVYLLYEPKNRRVEVETPVTDQTLEVARLKLLDLGREALNRERIASEGEGKKDLTPQQLADRQIKAIVQPAPIGCFRFVVRLAKSVALGFIIIVLGLMAISVISTGIHWSEERLPEKLHLVVLFLYAVGLTGCIYLMATEEIRQREIRLFRFLFGPYGLLFLPALTLIVAATLFASFTFWLYKHNGVDLQPCAGQPVSTALLLDFYVWHFLKLVPFLKLNETLKWGEPLCYTQARVGAFILLFQAVVVLPSINTIRFYWRNRRTMTAKPYKYVYEPGWKPESITNEHRTK